MPNKDIGGTLSPEIEQAVHNALYELTRSRCRDWRLTINRSRSGPVVAPIRSNKLCLTTYVILRQNQSRVRSFSSVSFFNERKRSTNQAVLKTPSSFSPIRVYTSLICLWIYWRSLACSCCLIRSSWRELITECNVPVVQQCTQYTGYVQTWPLPIARQRGDTTLFLPGPGKYHRFGRWYLVHFFSEQERCCTFSLSHIYLYPLYRVDIWAEVNEINSSTCHSLILSSVDNRVQKWAEDPTFTEGIE